MKKRVFHTKTCVDGITVMVSVFPSTLFTKPYVCVLFDDCNTKKVQDI